MVAGAGTCRISSAVVIDPIENDWPTASTIALNSDEKITWLSLKK
jgi:hypothetical protein